MYPAFHLLATAVLAWMAVLQLNDPDPLYWTVTYAAAASLPLLRLCRVEPRLIRVVLPGMIAAGLLITAPGLADYLAAGNYAALFGEMSPARPWVEPAREFLGLLIAGSVVYIDARIDHHKA